MDWGDKEHAYEIRRGDGGKASGTIASTPEAIHEWARSLRERFPTGTIAVAFGHGRWSVIYACENREIS